jgi:hypothetical protein
VRYYVWLRRRGSGDAKGEANQRLTGSIGPNRPLQIQKHCNGARDEASGRATWLRGI